MKPIRVVYLCEFPTLLGGERSLLTFLGHRTSIAIDPIVMAPGGERLAAALSDAGVRRIDWPRDGRRNPTAVADVLRPLDVALVHANSLMTSDIASAVGEVLCVPAVGHVRDIMNISSARRNRLARLARLIAVSDAVATRLGEQGLDPARIVRVYNGVDVERLRAAARVGALRAELGLTDSARLVGSAGQIALRKGQDLFLAAAIQVAETMPDVHFVIAGQRYSTKVESQTFEAELRALSDRPPLAGRTHWLGYRDDMSTVLADLDVLVVPSRQEPLSRVLLEGLALGVPAVATAVGGSPEILRGGEFGLLVEPDDAGAMARAVQTLLADAALCTRLKERGPMRIAEDFTPGANGAAIRALYDQILA